nr:predicted protein [Hordeum vulgare subsp. vulgare]
MAALAASRRLLLLLLRPELDPCLRPRALNPYSGRARWAGGVRRAPVLVSFRRGFSDEGSAYAAKNNAPDEQFLQLSLEGGEGDDVVPGISKSVVKDAKKSAIELLAVRAYSVSELRKKLCGKNYSVHTVDSVIADFKSR